MPFNTDVALKGEIPAEDFQIDEGKMHIVDWDSWWLHATVTGGSQWAGGAGLKEHEQKLANFFNEKVQGPYFVVPSFVNTRDTLSFVFLERSDAERFMEEFPNDHYRMDETGFAKNAELFKDRAEKLGWKPQDQRLMAYMPQTA